MKKTLVVSLMMCLALGTVTPILASDYEEHWAKQAITNCIDKGIIESSEADYFRPNDLITQDEFAKLIENLCGYTYEPSNSLDVDITREEAFYALATAYQLESDIELPFDDAAFISPYAVDAFKALYGNGYITGDNNNAINAHGYLTRAECVTLFDRLAAYVINQEGTYSEDVTGNLMVNVADVTLKDMTVYGNLYLTEGIGSGKVTLDNVIVTGNMFANEAIKVIDKQNDEVSQETMQEVKDKSEAVGIQMERLTGTVYRKDENDEDIVTNATIKVKNLSTGEIMEPIATTEGTYVLDLVLYQDYQIVAEATIDDIDYTDIQTIRSFKPAQVVDINLKLLDDEELKAQKFYEDRWNANRSL